MIQAENIVTKTTCPYCGVGCGVLVARDEAGVVSVKGDPDHPANFGRLCSKGSALAETIDFNGRLLTPMIDGEAASWDAALDRVADTFARVIAEHGPDAVALYVSGQILTEDYYVANKLMKGFIGSANIDTNSRLCMSSSVAGHKRAFGTDTVPGCYDDLEQADLLVLTGSNAAWCHPVLFQRMMAAKATNPACRVVVIDPRRTDTCDMADLHLAIRPGADVALFNGLLAHLHRAGRADAAFVANHTSGAAEALALVVGQTAAQTAELCGLSEQDVAHFFDLFAKTEKTVTLYSQGVNQSSSGTDKVNAIINCHLLTGRIGRPGMGPFSLTGQPNAMGGREVGGLANQLAAHMELDNPAHREIVQRFWASPKMADRPGLKAVDLFDAIHEGTVKAVWIMSTNPLVSLPDAEHAKAALEKCELVVVSDCNRFTDTTRHAHVLLPADTWGEKNGTVTNSERRISRQRPFMAAPGESKPDWWQLCEIAKRMGFSGFDFQNAAEIFAEHAALSGFENNDSRDFDISGLASLDETGFDALSPIQWPVLAGQAQGRARFFAAGNFYTPDRKARFIAVTPRSPRNVPSAEYPLVLNTGRVRDHWHTMTRTGKSPRLSAHIFEPFAEIHPDDAANQGLEQGALTRLTSAWGSMIARVKITPDQRRGSVFAPMHWTAEFASHGRVNALVNPAVDAISGQPESKHTPIRAEALKPRWQAFVLSRAPVAHPENVFCVEGHAGHYERKELAGFDDPENWDDWARKLLGQKNSETEWVAYRDTASRHYRFATVRDGRLDGCVFIAPDHKLPARDWVASLFAAEQLEPEARMSLLAGRPGKAGADNGPIVCSCFSIGQNQIKDAISGGCASVDAVGAKLKAGTNCGSCKPEISRMLKELTPAP